MLFHLDAQVKYLPHSIRNNNFLQQCLQKGHFTRTSSRAYSLSFGLRRMSCCNGCKHHSLFHDSTKQTYITSTRLHQISLLFLTVYSFLSPCLFKFQKRVMLSDFFVLFQYVSRNQSTPKVVLWLQAPAQHVVHHSWVASVYHTVSKCLGSCSSPDLWFHMTLGGYRNKH